MDEVSFSGCIGSPSGQAASICHQTAVGRFQPNV
jgi:hypothetical protein